MALFLRVAVGVQHVAGRVFAALAGVALAADAVHGDGQRLVRLLADRAVGHGAGLEALHDRLDRLDFLDRDRLVGELQLEQAAQRAEPLRLVVDQLAVLLEDLVIAGAAGVLELVDRLRVEQVILAVRRHWYWPPTSSVWPLSGRSGKARCVPGLDLGGDHVQADAADARRRPGEILVDDVLVQADGLEDLGAAVALDRRDAHLGHHLDHALVDRLDVVLDRLARGRCLVSWPWRIMSSSVSNARYGLMAPAP